MLGKRSGGGKKSLTPLAEKRAVALSCTDADRKAESGETDAWVRADKRRLVQMIRHLAENALKYAHTRADISVTDALELFGRVQGVDDPNTATGVGLALSAVIARGHDTELQFTENDAGGLDVSFCLQRGVATGEKGRAAVQSAARSARYRPTVPFCDALTD